MITRALAAVLSLIALWFLAMVLEALRVPAWVLAVNGGLLLVNVIVLIGSLHQATREPADPGGDGGIHGSRPDIPGSGGGDEPSWWPELERELRQYLAERERDERERRVTAGAVTSGAYPD
jgi:hypothetical protein